MKNIKATKTMSYNDSNTLLTSFTRKDLRTMARNKGIRVGRDKHDTVRNLAYSGDVKLTVTLS